MLNTWRNWSSCRPVKQSQSEVKPTRVLEERDMGLLDGLDQKMEL
jgi:hypothetical protein